MSTASMLTALAPAADARNILRPASAGTRGGTMDGQRLAESAVPGVSGESDEALALRVAGGDQRAFAEIVRRHGGRLRALAVRFVGGASEADDIVQEAFLSFWRTAGRWQPGGPALGAYLTRIAINRAIDGDRRRRLRRFFGLEDAAHVADPAMPADDRIAGRRELAAVAQDIAALPARQRAAVLLAADGERTNAEIAAAMGLSTGAVEQLLVRARRTLRMRLAGREG
jgi:RNA polymerase sigma-70 factor (ECF subfamily)